MTPHRLRRGASNLPARRSRQNATFIHYQALRQSEALKYFPDSEGTGLNTLFHWRNSSTFSIIGILSETGKHRKQHLLLLEDPVSRQLEKALYLPGCEVHPRM
jgi:hypothetical protein